MKRFSFSLQKIYDFKQQVFDVEMGILGEMQLVLKTLQQELEELKEELHLGSEELNRKYAEGITAPEIMQHKTYLGALGDGIVDKQRQIEMQIQAIERQKDKVREAKVELSTFEKLKEKKLEEYNYVAQKAEDQFIEEFVSNQRAMALMEGA